MLNQKAYTADDVRRMAKRYRDSGLIGTADLYEELADIKEKFEAGWKLIEPAKETA